MNKSPKAESNDQSGKYAALIQQLKNLEVEWKSLQKPMSRNNPRTRSSDSSILTSFDQLLLEKSPRSLMSSLQHMTSPNLLLRVRNSSCDVAVEEILRDRRAAVMSGKLKGRRLFPPAAAEDSDGSGEISSDLLDMSQHEKYICGSGKIRSLHDEMSVDFDQPCPFSDKEKVMVVEVEEEKSGGDRKLRGDGRHVVSMAWFAFLLILVTLGLISMSCNGKFVQENESILVPT
ncbi:hypothetical protein PHJA_002808400 [Phtheirospermum japonicum]|uniref:Uncharacterized protein n=1 Tax=Phtheirospermum japonicum TaxID=374723 RepID=A0A830DFA9_9LAMI|nr:hypothetical protein PHJA_002808400 [Phtheirospermum japonicum]